MPRTPHSVVLSLAGVAAGGYGAVTFSFLLL
jgi:hypothetical protein